MKTAKKLAGFFIVEILVVLVIIGILVTALMPNLTLYTQRAQFVDNLSIANAVKPAVEGCLLQNAATTTNCTQSASGIPADITGNMGSFVSSRTIIAGGTITVTSTGKFGTNGAGSYTYVLIPTLNTTSGVVTWSDSSSGCKAPGLC